MAVSVSHCTNQLSRNLVTDSSVNVLRKHETWLTSYIFLFVFKIWNAYEIQV